VRRAAFVSRREWLYVLLYTLFVLTLTTLPYVQAWYAQGDDWRFGGLLFGAEDGYSYLAKMRAGARGMWDFQLLYTSEPHAGAPLVYLHYLLPGQIVGLFMSETDPAIAPVLAGIYHLLRLAFDTLLIVVMYRFIAAFLRPPAARLTALVLATLGGGFGWVLALLGTGILPPEFYIPEGFTFLILFGLPHLALARAALLGGLLLFMDSLDRERWLGRAVLAGVVWLVVGLVVPFFLGVLYAVLGAWGLAFWLRCRAFPLAFARCALVAAGITAPLLGYYAILFSTNPAFAIWSAQNDLPSPPLWHYLLAYIVLLLPALVGIRWAWRCARLSARFALPVAWIIVALPLVYLPISVQRRLSEAVLVPLAILASAGLAAWVRRGLSFRRRFVPAALALIVIVSMSSLLFVVGSLGVAIHPAPPLFRPVEELAAFDWLNNHAPPDAVVLASVPTGNVLPVYAHVRVHMGHGPETLHWQAKTRDVERFFGDAMTADERRALFEQYGIDYVFYGPLERALAPLPDSPAWADDLALIYEEVGYQIYATGQ
jgi:hypothetical protein